MAPAAVFSLCSEQMFSPRSQAPARPSTSVPFAQRTKGIQRAKSTSQPSKRKRRVRAVIQTTGDGHVVCPALCKQLRTPGEQPSPKWSPDVPSYRLLWLRCFSDVQRGDCNRWAPPCRIKPPFAALAKAFSIRWPFSGVLNLKKKFLKPPWRSCRQISQPRTLHRSLVAQTPVPRRGNEVSSGPGFSLPWAEVISTLPPSPTAPMDTGSFSLGVCVDHSSPWVTYLRHSLLVEVIYSLQSSICLSWAGRDPGNGPSWTEGTQGLSRPKHSDHDLENNREDQSQARSREGATSSEEPTEEDFWQKVTRACF